MPRLVATLALFVSSPAMAQVSPIDAFSGEFSEGFETQGATTAAVQCIEPTLDGHATVCSPNAQIGGMHLRRDWYLTCLQDAHSGDYQTASNDSWVEVNFDVPMQRFGGYFGTHGNPGEVSLIFFDRDNVELGRVVETFVDLDNSGDLCDWQWVGGETPNKEGIWKVRIRHSDHAGALVDIDDLEASTGCGLSDLDCDGSPSSADCDDLDPDSHPGATELCDDVDQDCDLSIDEDAIGAAYSSEQSGVCAGSYQICTAGSWVDPDFTALPGYESPETSCDNIDNDCDGQADVGLLGGPASQGEGVCADLRQECAGEAGWVDPNDWASQVAYEPTEVTCDGEDNDCDGAIDEDLEAPLASTQFGVCQGADAVCGGAEGWVDPNFSDYASSYDATDSSCDAVDNDCDGAFDEGCPPPSTNTTRNPFAECGCSTGPSSPLAWTALPLLLVGLRRRR